MATTSVASNGIVHEVLTKDNYDNWSVLVRNYLLGLGLWDVVESVPNIDVKNKAEYQIWRRENAKALHIIQLSCGLEILAEIKHFDGAKEAWSHLRASFGLDLKANPDIEQGLVDDDPLQNKPLLHKYVEKDNWNDAKSLINENEMAIFSTCSSGRTALHVAVTAGHGNIVEELVKEGKDRLVKIQDRRGYTALALAADLTGNTNIAKCMIESSGGEDLLTMETEDGEIPVLLAASKGHKEMTRYLYPKTPLEALVDENAHKGASLLTRCITAQIFDVALSLLKRSKEAQLPLTHESDGIRPLNALANMPSAFPSGRPTAPRQLLWYEILKPETKLQDSDGIAIEIVSHVAQDEGRHKTSWTGQYGLHSSLTKPIYLIKAVLYNINV